MQKAFSFSSTSYSEITKKVQELISDGYTVNHQNVTSVFESDLRLARHYIFIIAEKYSASGTH